MVSIAGQKSRDWLESSLTSWMFSLNESRQFLKLILKECIPDVREEISNVLVKGSYTPGPDQRPLRGRLSVETPRQRDVSGPASGLVINTLMFFHSHETVAIGVPLVGNRPWWHPTFPAMLSVIPGPLHLPPTGVNTRLIFSWLHRVSKSARPILSATLTVLPGNTTIGRLII
jgi:hypothetical protein